MSSVRYYADEHVGNAVVQGLRQRGVDILTVVEAGMLSATDEAQLAFALNASRVIFTQDGDFLRLAASGVSHAGIVYAPQGTSIGPITVDGSLTATTATAPVSIVFMSAVTAQEYAAQRPRRCRAK